jgi:PQQ-dependent catabolism-associated beta-propeller protein
VEPEGMAVSPDDKTVVCTSETTSMAHFIDVASAKVVASVLVGTRPRFAAFTGDGSKVWVSSEVAGSVAVIDVATHKILKTIHFDLPEVPTAAIQAVGINLTKDGKLAFVDLGPANRVAVIDQQSFEVKSYLLVGQRVWHNAFSPDQKLLYTANGISNDMSVINVPDLEVTQSVPVGQSPWGVVIAD